MCFQSSSLTCVCRLFLVRVLILVLVLCVSISFLFLSLSVSYVCLSLLVRPSVGPPPAFIRHNRNPLSHLHVGCAARPFHPLKAAMGGEASKPVAPPAAYNCVDDMSAADRERYHRVVARAPSSPRQTIAVIGPLHSGKSSFMNTAYRIMTNTWGEDTAGVCTSGSFAMAESFMTSAVKAVGKLEWRFQFLDTPHVLEDVARNPAEMALLRAILHGVELNTVLRDRECRLVF